MQSQPASPRFLPGLSAAALLLTACTPLPADAHARYQAPGRLVDVAIEVEGRVAPLYHAPDGSGRYYLEAQRGARYSVRISNRSGERLAVLLAVDGLNAVSGELEPLVLDQPAARPGRMYVLAPWDGVTVRGWRRSLDEIRRFTFVDEEASYAARSEKTNRKLGWIEVRVFRERRQAHVWREPWKLERDSSGAERPEASADEGAAARDAAPAPAAPESEAPASKSRRADDSSRQAGAQPGRSYPGTGWGAREDDPARVVHFDPQAQASDALTLRYEYRRELVALGVLPSRRERDRLAERDGAYEPGFARPPLR